MYIEITVDLKNYTGDRFDIRLSNYYTVKQFIDVVWQVKNIQDKPREGYWIRVQNKNIDEKVLMTEDSRNTSLMDTRGIKSFYITILLGLLGVTFLLLLPRFIRGTKEST